MFQHDVDRLAPLFQSEQIYMVPREDQSALLSSQMTELTLASIISEPVGRGTAPAIGQAAIHLRKKDPEATMAVLTADHYITGTEQFRRVLEIACSAAKDGHLVTLGIKPASPRQASAIFNRGAPGPSQ